MRQWVQPFITAALLIGLAVPVDMLVTTPVYAEEKEPPKRKTRRVPSMSEQTFKKLSEAQELVDVKDYQGALDVLQGMLNRGSRYNGNEIGQINNMLGFVYYSKEDYKGAIDAYTKVVQQGDQIPEGLETTTLYTLAQLHFVTENFNEALRYMRTWISKANNPGPEPHIFMGQVYYQMKDFPASIEQIEQGISVAKERGTKVKENWWTLLNYLYFEQEDWDKVIEILEILVRDFPKRDYWMRLAGVHGQEGHEKKQMYSYEAAHVAGFLTREGDLTNYAGLLMQEEVPYRAARVLDTGFKEEVIERTAKNLRSLGQAWQLAQEVDKAIPVLEEAGRLSDDGKIYERLAHLYLEDDKYDACVTASNGALEKGGLRKKHAMYMIRGMCFHNADNLDNARKSFVSCRNGARSSQDNSTLRICQQWITYIDKEAQRRAQLDAAI